LKTVLCRRAPVVASERMTSWNFCSGMRSRSSSKIIYLVVEPIFPCGDTGGGPVFLSDPNGYVYRGTWPEPVANPCWTSPRSISCQSTKDKIVVAIGDKNNSFSYPIDTSPPSWVRSRTDIGDVRAMRIYERLRRDEYRRHIRVVQFYPSRLRVGQGRPKGKGAVGSCGDLSGNRADSQDPTSSELTQVMPRGPAPRSDFSVLLGGAKSVSRPAAAIQKIELSA
jgi:hypothetical protein